MWEQSTTLYYEKRMVLYTLGGHTGIYFLKVHPLPPVGYPVGKKKDSDTIQAEKAEKEEFENLYEIDMYSWNPFTAAT